MVCQMKALSIVINKSCAEKSFFSKHRKKTLMCNNLFSKNFFFINENQIQISK